MLSLQFLLPLLNYVSLCNWLDFFSLSSVLYGNRIYICIYICLCFCVSIIKSFCIYFTDLLSDFDRLQVEKNYLIFPEIYFKVYICKELAAHFRFVMNQIFTVLFTWIFGLKQASEDLRRLEKHPILLDLRHFLHKSECKIFWP